MPIFEFVCPACGKRFERILKQAADSAACPACGTVAARQVSAASVGGAVASGGCAPRSGFS